MREIKFRGQRTDTREWVYGDLVQNSVIDALIYGEQSRVWAVIPSTIGQFTGLLDKNGKEIYEGDIVDNLFQGIHQILLCEWTDNGFHFRDYKDGIDKRITMGIVIGNIHEVKND